MNKHAVTSVPVLDQIKERWSPRAFVEGYHIPDETLTAALEAARWAPSAGNSQPARFIVATDGTQLFATILAKLNETNAMWARNSSVLIVNVAETENANGAALPWAVYDLGQAVAYFSVQAHAGGLSVHQMGGFDGEGLHSELNLSESQNLVSVMAVGKLGDPHDAGLLPRHLEQELSPRVREELAVIARIA